VAHRSVEPSLKTYGKVSRRLCVATSLASDASFWHRNINFLRCHCIGYRDLCVYEVVNNMIGGIVVAR
jgi:hypothetical protein